MKGHIRERSPGRWAIIIELRDPVTGTRRRKWHSFEGTKRQAQDEGARLISEMRSGTYVEPSKVTMAQHLERWLDHVKSQVSPRTHERYSEIVRKNIVPVARRDPPDKAEAGANLRSVYQGAGLRPSGRKGGLAPTTVIYMHRLIKHALAQAVRWELLTRNPADAVSPPKVERATMNTFDMPQTAELDRGAARHPTVDPGDARRPVRAEARRDRRAALAQRRPSSRQVDDRRECGADRVRRPVQAAEVGKGPHRRAVRHHGRGIARAPLRQAEEMLRLGIRQDEANFVYAREDGEPMQPRSLTHAWQMVIGKIELPRVRFHDLRHAHATHLLSNGVHPKVASERLGHSRVGITLDLYSHVLPGMQEDAAIAR